MAQHTVVVVEDDGAIRRGLVDALRLAGYRVLEAGDGRAGLRIAIDAEVDLVLLDVMLPKLDGFDVLAALREQHPLLPVIMLTARGAEQDRVTGLRRGADDYVVKPFSVRELLARVEAVLRRSRHSRARVGRLIWRAVIVDLDRHELRHSVDHRHIDLTGQEATFVHALAVARGEPISRDQLLEDVWGVALSGAETRTVDMLVARLREKLRGVGGDGADELLQTVRGRGYRLATEATVEAAAS